jgi:hypothetical protein
VLKISSFVLMLLMPAFVLKISSFVDVVEIQLRAEDFQPSVDVDDAPAFVL